MVLQRYEMLMKRVSCPKHCVAVARRRRLPPGRCPAIIAASLATGFARCAPRSNTGMVGSADAAAFTLPACSAASKSWPGGGAQTNFRRLSKRRNCVEESRPHRVESAGRPAKLFRFRHAVLAKRAFAVTKLPLAKFDHPGPDGPLLSHSINIIS